MKTSILEYLEESARKYPDKTAFADEHTSCTFKELSRLHAEQGLHLRNISHREIRCLYLWRRA